MNESFFDSLEDYKLEKREYCFLMEDSDKYSETFKVYFPKVMPFFNMKEAVKTWKDYYEPTVFVNDAQCLPTTYGNYITLQNYMTINRKRNSWFKFHPSVFKKGTRLLCELPEQNIRHIRLLDDEFNVDQADKETGKSFIRNPSFEILDKINSGDTVQVAYPIYLRIPVQDVEPEMELDSTGTNTLDFDLHYSYITDYTGESIYATIDSQRTQSNILRMDVSNGTVVSKHDWGLIVEILGVNRHITPDRILGFYKNPGEYNSYYEDSNIGG
jgi:hypothetical protein